MSLPLFKGKGCKSTPKKAINYITNEKKAEIVTSYALDNTRDYAEQFRETAQLYNKGDKFDERKYYHFKQSFAPGEITPENAHKLAEEMVKRTFANYECVIATHTDKDHIHSHIIVNSVNFEDGKKLNLRNYEYGQLKDLSNTIAQEHGYSVLDWRKPSKEKITQAEKHIILKGGTSWKEELKDVIAEGINQSNNFIEFRKFLEKYDVTIERNTEKTISFKHPQKQKAIRGERLGTDFTKGAILNGINQQRNRGISTEQEYRIGTFDSSKENSGIEPTDQGRVRKQSTQGEFDGVHRIIREVEKGTKQYSPTGREEIRRMEREQREKSEQIKQQRRKLEESQRIARRKYKNRSNEYDYER